MSVPRPPTPIEVWLTVPLAFSVSPGSIFTIVPAGIPSGRRSSGQPAKFWPKSNTHTPGCGFVSFTGVNVRWTFTGSAVRAASFVVRFGGGAIPALRQPTSVPSRRFADVGQVAPGRPAGLLAPRVVVGAPEPVVGDRRAERGAPVAVRDDGLGRAVGVGDLEPPDQPRRDHRARARVERGQRVARAGHRRARRVRRVERRRERDAGAGRGDRGARGVRLASAPGSNVTPVPGRSRSRTDAPCAWTIVSGALSVMPVPLAPAVPTAVIVRVSRLSPESTVIRVADLEAGDARDPAAPRGSASRASGRSGSTARCRTGRPRTPPATTESSNAAVFQPAGGVAGVPVERLPRRVGDDPLVVERERRRSAPPPLPALVPAIAITFVPATSSGLTSTIWDVCQALLPPPDCATCWPLTYVTCESSALIAQRARGRCSPGRRRERLAHVDRAGGRAGRVARDVPDPARALQRRRRRAAPRRRSWPPPASCWSPRCRPG